MLKLPNGKRTGIAFIVLSTPDEANAALAANNKPFKDRILHVEISSAKGRAAPLDRARKEDVSIKHTASASPDPERRGSDVSMTTSQGGAATNAYDNTQKNSRERKIAILNLPDTVNDARIRTAMESYGPLMKIQMRRDDNGAIIEFANLQDAFNVRQGVDCSSLGSGVRTGDVNELLRKGKKNQAGQGERKVAFAPSGISRPMQRGGRRGGLGSKRGGSAGVGSGEGRSNGDSAAKKSNSDFRDIFTKGKEDTSKAEGEGDD